MRFTIKTDSGIQVLVLANVLETARALSQAFPGEEIWVFACNRGRLCVEDGHVIYDKTDLSTVEDFSNLVDGIGERLVHELTKQWSTLDCGVPEIQFLSSTSASVNNDDFHHIEARQDWIDWTGLDPIGHQPKRADVSL